MRPQYATATPECRPPRPPETSALHLARGPENRREHDADDGDDEPGDPALDFARGEDRAEGDADADDPTGGHEAHHQPLKAEAPPLTGGQHVALAGLSRGRPHGRVAATRR